MNEVCSTAPKAILLPSQLLTLDTMISNRLSFLVIGTLEDADISLKETEISHKDLSKIKEFLYFLQRDGFGVGGMENLFEIGIKEYSSILTKIGKLLNFCVNNIHLNSNYYKLAKFLLNKYSKSFSTNFFCNLQGFIYFNKIRLKTELSEIKYREYCGKVDYFDNILGNLIESYFYRKK